jgi:hydroxymethylglutaryl-CoA synthase
MYSRNKSSVGIDDIAAHFPGIFLRIEDLSTARNIEYAKLNKGLGLTAMSLADVHEDAATMAANAVRKLIEQNNVHPSHIGRIYLGTESALDGSKPTSSYALDMLHHYFMPKYGSDCFLNCDVVDLTFACIGAVDALQNSLDWVRSGEDRIAIVIGSDIAKYELASTGEYTQGAGAVALLIKEHPRLLAFDESWGVATRPVHDFFKPIRTVQKKQVLAEAAEKGIGNNPDYEKLEHTIFRNLEQSGFWDSNETNVHIHKATPVFDGPYSNTCYQERIKEALNHYIAQNNLSAGEAATDNWRRLIFHLPYAYQARRMFSEIFYAEAKKRGDSDILIQEMGQTEPMAQQFEDESSYQEALSKFLTAVTKTERYKRFVVEKIEKGERASSLMGNLYTASIFLSLMSTLAVDLENDTELTDARIGFFAYGSGSKSKVFTATVQSSWREITEKFRLFQQLESRTSISYLEYEALHRENLTQSIRQVEGEFYLASICAEKGVKEGARRYGWSPAKVLSSVRI